MEKHTHLTSRLGGERARLRRLRAHADAGNVTGLACGTLAIGHVEIYAHGVGTEVQQR